MFIRLSSKTWTGYKKACFGFLAVWARSKALVGLITCGLSGRLCGDSYSLRLAVFSFCVGDNTFVDEHGVILLTVLFFNYIWNIGFVLFVFIVTDF